jgi:adenylate cyclase class 2
VASAAAAQQMLRAAGAALVAPRGFEDNVLYDDAAGTLSAAGRTLRLRRSGETGLLTYKGPGTVVGDVKSREEIQTQVADAEALAHVLRAIGFLPRFRYQKYRETYRHGRLDVVVDETPIGTFVEIEGEPEAIHALAARLGYAREDYVLESYPALFFAGGGAGDMVFRERG